MFFNKCRMVYHSIPRSRANILKGYIMKNFKFKVLFFCGAEVFFNTLALSIKEATASLELTYPGNYGYVCKEGL